MNKFLTFGEVMARMAPPGFLRLRQSLPGSLEVTFAGAEANVAVSLAQFGAEVSFLSCLPQNPPADACVAQLQGLGVGTQHTLRRDAGRLGIYFVETGANQRPGRVTYDREFSSISLDPPSEAEWQEALEGVSHLHVTGITPALSQAAADSTRTGARLAHDKGIQVSLDLNFRSALWRWRPDTQPRLLAREIMESVLPYTDILIANEADCGDVLDIHAADSSVESGHVAADSYPQVAEEVVRRFPNIRLVATTLRESISATHNNWGAMLYSGESGSHWYAPVMHGDYRPYEIRNIVDRVGAGDAFAAALLFALAAPEYSDPQRALSFAAASSCLAHSIRGDFNFTSRAEAEALMGGNASGRVVR